MRRTPIARKTRLKSSGRIKPKKRSTKEFARIYGSEARVEWIAMRCCVACGFRGCENAHTAGDGVGRKGGYEKIIPLCATCHRLQHQIGAGTFAIRYQLDLRALAAATEAKWRAHLQERTER
jgi:hypothetical protein